MRQLFTAAVLAVVGLGFSAPAAAAEEPSAQALYDSGMADLKAQKFATACASLRQSFRLEALPETLFHLAECEEGAHRVTSAAATYDDYLALYDQLPASTRDEERGHEKLASERRRALDAKIPHVIFRLPATVPDGTKVTRRASDAKDRVEVVVGVQLPIDPGEHYVMTELTGRAPWEKRFFINEGENKTVELDVSPPTKGAPDGTRMNRPIAPVPTMLPPLNPGISGRRVGAYVVGSVGLAGIVLGAVTGVVVWGQKGVVTDNCRDGATRLCNPKGESASDTAATFGTVSTVSFAVGLTCLVGGIVLYATEPAPARLGSTPRFTALGVNPAQSGASLAGTWAW
jgi:hypothetical protein